MPTYTFLCEKCNKEEEVNIPVERRNDVHLHSCGCAMKRLLSLPQPPIMRFDGRDMALNTLNSGTALPNRWYKKKYEKIAAKGLERPPKEIW